MTVDWSMYEPFDPHLYKPYEESSLAEARAAFDNLIKNKDERIEQLRKLLAANGTRLDATDEGLQRLEDWFKDHVEPDPTNPRRLAPIWYSVVADIATFIGEVMIERRNQLRWELYQGTSSRDLLHHWPTVAGFSEEPRAVAPEQIVAMVANRAITGLPTERDEFVQLVREAETA